MKNYELKGVSSDYSQKENWMHIPEITKEADTIYLYPTAFIDPSPGAPSMSTIDDESMHAGAQFMFGRQATAFMESTNVFAPYYRQGNLAVLAGMAAEELIENLHQEGRTDVFGALDYYFEHYNGGRPFILASHSQGSSMTIIVLEEYMREHPEYYERMIAAYVLGFSVTQDDLEENPHLKFAEGADDTGVIISWNTEGPENKGSESLLLRPNTIAINPINWKRDDTYASREENMGSRTMNMETGEYSITKPGIADARLDTERGTVICTTLPEAYVTTEALNGIENPFGPASLHGMDYDAYYFNLQANVKTRVEKFLAK
ncbi:MAG: DUF3089 domain-containing protein [Lachnospiraceae bacterium]|nr:DUF3089 domain-containing protein [Lachnospiraceae bacterium]